MDADSAARDEWSLVDGPDEWTLRVKFRVRLRDMPSFPVRTLIVIAVPSLFLAGLVGLGPQRDSAASFPLGVALPVTAGLFLWTAGWWFWQTPFMQSYRHANRTMSVTVRDGKVTTDVGIFDVGHLASLRVEADSALGGRQALVFTSNSMPAAEFVGWPGLPPDIAADVFAEAHGRLSTGALTNASTCGVTVRSLGWR